MNVCHIKEAKILTSVIFATTLICEGARSLILTPVLEFG